MYDLDLDLTDLVNLKHSSHLHHHDSKVDATGKLLGLSFVELDIEKRYRGSSHPHGT